MRSSNRRRRMAVPMVTCVEVCESRQLLSGHGLEARLTGNSGQVASAEYKVRESIRSFEVAVLVGAQGTYDVSVSNVVVGRIQVGSAGTGSLELTDNPRDADEFAFPSNWPGVDAGTEVRIQGLASGTLAVKGEDDHVVASHFFQFSGSGAQIGTAQFEIEAERGIEQREFELEAFNLAPSTDFPLLINGTPVATVTSSVFGVVRVRYSDKTRPDALPFPSAFPAVNSATVISLGADDAAITSQVSTRPDDRGQDNGVTHLRVSLIGAGAESGAASFEVTAASGGIPASSEFKVELWNAPAGAVYEVKVGGISVGSVTIGRRGFGRLQFESGDDRKPFPQNWPGISSGTVVTVGQILSGTFIGAGRVADPSNQDLNDAYQIDHALGLRSTGDYFENHGGRGEKWMRDSKGHWYFVTPDGGLYKWDGQTGANGSLVTILDASFHERPEVLHDSQPVQNLAMDDRLLRATAAELDQEFELSVGANTFENHGGKGERWIKGRKHWFFITPDGTLTRWDRKPGANGEVIGKLDSRFHHDLTRLTNATRWLNGVERAYALDRGLEFTQPARDYFNFGGKQEKWILGSERWYFITPDGAVHRWNGKPGANGTVLTYLPKRYYDDTKILTDAAITGTAASRSMLDDVFADNVLL